MSPIALVALGALLLYLALRVGRMKRSLPFVFAYPLFVIILLGGSAAIFVGATHSVVRLGLDGEDPRALIGVYAATAVGALVLWFVARRAIR